MVPLDHAMLQALFYFMPVTYLAKICHVSMKFHKTG